MSGSTVLMRKEILLANDTATPTFTVDNTKFAVPVTQNAALPTVFCPVQGNVSSDYPNAIFAPNDCVLITGYGLWLPYNFQLADQGLVGGVSAGFSAPALYFYPINTHGVAPVYFMDPPGLAIPRENYQFDCDYFVNQQSLATLGGKFYFIGSLNGNGTQGTGTITVAEISMANVPGAFNGMTFKARPVLFINHSLAMVSPG